MIQTISNFDSITKTYLFSSYYYSFIHLFIILFIYQFIFLSIHLFVCRTLCPSGQLLRLGLTTVHVRLIICHLSFPVFSSLPRIYIWSAFQSCWITLPCIIATATLTKMMHHWIVPPHLRTGTNESLNTGEAWHICFRDLVIRRD